MADRNKGQPQAGPNRHNGRRTGRSKPSPLPRSIMIAVGFGVLAAAFLFWPRGGSSPAGIGERSTVVTAQGAGGSSSLGQDGPRSGEVILDQETLRLVPEQAGGRQPAPQQTPANPPATTTDPDPANDISTQNEHSLDQPSQVTEPHPTPKRVAAGQLSSHGEWALQLGAFGNQQNAADLVAELRRAGYSPTVHQTTNASGRLFYRVRIGFFSSRENATDFAHKHKGEIGEAIPVPR